MEVSLKVKISAGDIYDYLLYHHYTSAAGLIGSCVGALLVVSAFLTNTWIFIVAGLVILLYLPWVSFLKSRTQAKTNPAFKNEMTYLFNDEGLTVSVGEDSASCKWDDMYKAVSTGKSIILYTSPINATIIPKRYLLEKKQDLIAVISTHLPARKVKIKE